MTKLKYIIYVLFILTISLFISCNNEEKIPEIDISDLKIGIVYSDLGNIKGNYNEYAKEAIIKAQNDYSFILEEITTTSKDDRLEKIEKITENNDYIIVMGVTLSGLVKEVAEKNPDKIFITIDREIEGDNVISVTFSEEEVGYIAGMLAAYHSETSNIAFIARLPNEKNFKYRDGFLEGAKHINSKIKILSYISGPSSSSIYVTQYIEENINELSLDVIFSQNPAFTEPFIDLSEKYDVDLITLNSDYFEKSPEKIIANMVNDYYTAVYKVIQMIARETLMEQKVIKIGLKDNANYIIENNISNNKFITNKIKDSIKSVKKDIINGDISIIIQDNNSIIPK